MTDYMCGKCHSVLTSGKVCTVCCFDNQPFIDCFVCKNQLTEGKCMTPTCPKNKDNHTFKGSDGAIYTNVGGGVLVKSDGGPSTYFDLCNGGTLNDELERKGDEQWLGDSFHLGNVVKLAWRWGIKEGTDKAYDANKLIYSGARLLMKYKGVAAVRKSLQKLLDDPQFQEREKDK
jgi:hypothetical protein